MRALRRKSAAKMALCAELLSTKVLHHSAKQNDEIRNNIKILNPNVQSQTPPASWWLDE